MRGDLSYHTFLRGIQLGSSARPMPHLLLANSTSGANQGLKANYVTGVDFVPDVSGNAAGQVMEWDPIGARHHVHGRTLHGGPWRTHRPCGECAPAVLEK